MRCVDLTRTAPALGEAEALRVQKLTGHLWARLMELEEDGLRVLSPTDPKAGRGEVRVQFPAGEGRTAVQRLGERYVLRVMCALPWGPTPPLKRWTMYRTQYTGTCFSPHNAPGRPPVPGT